MKSCSLKHQKLENQTWYTVYVSCFDGNPFFNALLYVGFINDDNDNPKSVSVNPVGAELLHSNYSCIHTTTDVLDLTPEMRIKKVKKLPKW